MLRLADLLNPASNTSKDPSESARPIPSTPTHAGHVQTSNNGVTDIWASLQELSTRVPLSGPVHAPLEVTRAISIVLGHLQNHSATPSPSMSPSTDSSSVGTPSRLPPSSVSWESDVSLTRYTTLSRLFRYTKGTILEYPETHSDHSIGHLFEMDAVNWVNPVDYIAYSRGAPMGGSKKNKPAFCDVLRDSVTGECVPCREFHTTCM